MTHEVPEGWTTTTLGEICSKPQYGWTCRGAKAGRIKYVRTTDISGGVIDWATVPYCEEAPEDIDKYRLKPNDILVSRAGSVGISLRITEVPCCAVFASYLIRFNPLLGIEPKYVESFLKSGAYWRAISDFTAGIALPNVNASKLASLELPLAPRAEQCRIAKKLERLLSKVDACEDRLTKLPSVLKRFRKSVLAAACSGRLTEDWRKRTGVSDEYEQTVIENIAGYVGGFAYKSPTFLETGEHQVIRIGNVRPLLIKLEASPVFIPEEIAKQSSRFRLLPDDIAISMTGTKYKQDYGYAAIVRESDGSLFVNQRVAGLRCTAKVLPKFLLYWLQTDRFRDFFFAGETGNVNQGNVGADGIRKAPIELPSRDEQHEIVCRVEALFNLMDQIEGRCTKVKEYVAKLTQAALDKAFRGDLVPTEAEIAKVEGREFESADELLARVQAPHNAG